MSHQERTKAALTAAIERGAVPIDDLIRGREPAAAPEPTEGLFGPPAFDNPFADEDEPISNPGAPALDDPFAEADAGAGLALFRDTARRLNPEAAERAWPNAETERPTAPPGRTIVSLTAENVKRLRAVQIQPDGPTVVIGGRNAQGKSSVLDCIEFALAGKGPIPPNPIRDGENEAYIVADLGDVRVERRFARKYGREQYETELLVRGADGFPVRSPQQLLDRLLGKLAFDPLAFARMKPRDQRDTLRDVVGLDTSDLDAERKKLYDERTLEGRIERDLEGHWKELPFFPDAPEEPIDLEPLREELTQILAANAGSDAARRNVEALRTGLSQLDQHLAGTEREIQRLQQRLAELQERRPAMARQIEQAEDEAASLAFQDPEAARARIRDAEAANRKYAANLERGNARESAETQAAVVADYTTQIAALDAQKGARIKAARFPVEGLALGEDRVLFNGLPFEQASSAEQLRTSIAMGLALNPELRVLLIRDGSLLDPDSLRMVAAMADEAGAQVWIERVSDGEEVQIVIEDGMVAETREALP